MCVVSEGFAFRYAPFKSFFYWYTENDLFVLIVKGRLLNHLNPFHSVYKLYVKASLMAATSHGCYLERANFSKEDAEG